MAQAVASMRISSGNSLGPCRTLFPWDLFSASKECVEPNQGVLEHARAYRPCHSALLWLCVAQWQGGSHSRFGDGARERTGLQTVASCWGCTIWSIEPRVSARRGKCAQAKWTYSTWRAYRCVFTCLLSQVVQTGRLPFRSDCGQHADCFCRAGRVNGTNTGKCLQSSTSAHAAFRLQLWTNMRN